LLSPILARPVKEDSQRTVCPPRPLVRPSRACEDRIPCRGGTISKVESRDHFLSNSGLKWRAQWSPPSCEKNPRVCGSRDRKERSRPRSSQTWSDLLPRAHHSDRAQIFSVHNCGRHPEDPAVSPSCPHLTWFRRASSIRHSLWPDFLEAKEKPNSMSWRHESFCLPLCRHEEMRSRFDASASIAGMMGRRTRRIIRQ
jgi:hypothetical protein